MVFERSGLMQQIRIHECPEDGSQMELWCVRDNVKDSEIKFCVQTLYNLRLRKHSVEAVNREHILPY